MKAFYLVVVIIMLFSFMSCRKADNPRHTGMPDPNIIEVQDSVRHVNMDYGTDNIRTTVYKPENARFEVTPIVAADGVKRVSLVSNEKKWRADIFSAVSADTNSQEVFVEYYFNGTLGDAEESFDYYNQQVTDLDMDYRGNPIKYIVTAYKKKGDRNLYEARFIGFEFQDTLRGEPNGKGLMGFKIYDFSNDTSLSFCRGLFCELFYPER